MKIITVSRKVPLADATGLVDRLRHAVSSDEWRESPPGHCRVEHASWRLASPGIAEVTVRVHCSNRPLDGETSVALGTELEGFA